MWDTWQCLETLFIVMTEGQGVCPQHLVGKGQGAIKHLTVHKTAPKTKNSLAQSVTGTEVEKPGSRFIQSGVWELGPYF